jgi:CCR4-NOT transcription complex subunit 6
MYSKKIDERTSSSEDNGKLPPHSRRSNRPPPPHDFLYRWFRGPPVDICGSEHCPRRTSFSPVDWTKYALQGGLENQRDTENPCRLYGAGDATLTSNILCTLECVSTQSSLYKRTFCNAKCFVEAWRHQQQANSNGSTLSPKGAGTFQRFNSTASNPSGVNWERSNSGEGSVGPLPDDVSLASMGSANSALQSSGVSQHQPTTPPPNFLSGGAVGGGMVMSANGTPTGVPSRDGETAGNRSRAGSYNLSSSNPYADDIDCLGEEDWVEISRNAFYVPTELDMGRKLSLEATAVSHSGKTLMQRIVKTDLVLSRPPDPIKRNLLTASNVGKSTNVGARFRMVTYNVLSEIYATQQQYPYCDFWALSSEYR